MKLLQNLVVLLGLVSSVAAYADDLHRISLSAGDCATLDHQLIPNTNYQIFIEQLSTHGCAQNLVTYVTRQSTVNLAIYLFICSDYIQPITFKSNI